MPVIRDGFVVETPASEGIDPDALELLITRAEEEHSDALVIVKNGKLVFESYFGGKDEPMMAMSVSKAFVSIAFGFLLAEGKLASLDEPITKTLPDFAVVNPKKAKMTCRHLLTQTSGLRSEAAAKLTPIVGKRSPSFGALVGAVRGLLSADEAKALEALMRGGDHVPSYANLAVGPARGYAAEGWLGQFLFVVPDKKLVAVRMRRSSAWDYSADRERQGFWSFRSEVGKLVP